MKGSGIVLEHMLFPSPPETAKTTASADLVAENLFRQ